MQRSLKRRIMMMYGVYLSLTLGFIWVILGCVPAWAAPAITGVSGTVSNGSAITVTGAGFGANGPTVLLFDDFEGGTNGNSLSLNLAPLGVWDNVQNAPLSTYSNVNKLSGNLAARFNVTDYIETGYLPNISAVSPSNFDTFYVSWWVLLPTGNVFPSTGHVDGLNWKVMWEWHDNDADVGLWSNGFNDWKTAGNDYPDNSYFPGATFTMRTGTWYRFQMYNKGRTNATGQSTVLTTDSINNTVYRLNRTGVITLNSGDTNKRHRFNINGYVKETVGSCYPTFDDVYIAYGEYAQARVEIGNRSTYTRCSNLTITTQILWSDTQIMTTVRQGSFSLGQTAYLYVFDANGNVNSQGFPVTIGTIAGGPLPPTGVMID